MNLVGPLLSTQDVQHYFLTCMLICTSLKYFFVDLGLQFGRLVQNAIDAE